MYYFRPGEWILYDITLWAFTCNSETVVCRYNSCILCTYNKEREGGRETTIFAILTFTG